MDHRHPIKRKLFPSQKNLSLLNLRFDERLFSFSFFFFCFFNFFFQIFLLLSQKHVLGIFMPRKLSGNKGKVGAAAKVTTKPLSRGGKFPALWSSILLQARELFGSFPPPRSRNGVLSPRILKLTAFYILHIHTFLARPCVCAPRVLLYSGIYVPSYVTYGRENGQAIYPANKYNGKSAQKNRDEV